MDTMTPSPRRRRFALPVAVTAALTVILGAAAGVGAAVQAASAPTTLRYGDHDRQVVTVYRGAAERPPLAVYIHGGAWRMGSPERVRAKPQWFGEAGWAFASVGYRVLPDAQVEEQAQDVAAGLRALRADAARLGFDPDRILIMGHSAGAHLAALVATDGRYLGADRAAVRGVILLDGAGYDVSNEFNLRGPLARKLYGDAFGEDPARQRTLSPIAHVDAQDPPDWLIVFAESRVDAREQAAQFGDALQRAGLRVERIPDPGNHMEINREFGTAGYRANAAVRALMSRVAGQG
jgi:acetyl esterase/lipase